jgi:hypothetical protein
MDFFSPFTRFAKLKPANRAVAQPPPAPRATAAELAKAKAAEAAAEAELQYAIRQSHERARIFKELREFALNPEKDPFAHLAGVDFGHEDFLTPCTEREAILMAIRSTKRTPSKVAGRPSLSVVPNAIAKMVVDAAATARAGGPPLPPSTDPTVKFVLDADRKRRGESE